MAKLLKDIGASRPYFNDDVSDTKQTVQTGETLLFGYDIHNVTAADAFLLLYDALAADVTVGTTTPTYVIPVGANGIEGNDYAIPLEFDTGLVIASTTATDGATGAAQDVSFRIG